MREDHRDRLLLRLPYSMGCASESCIAVGRKNQATTVKKQKHLPTSEDVIFPSTPRKKGEKERRSMAKMGRIRSYFVLPNCDAATRVNRMIKRFKSFSKLLVYEGEDEEEDEREIEIGFPTDVKHVTHIGWDGATTVNPIKGWENLQAAEILSLSSTVSLKQFELAMHAQAGKESVCISSTKVAQKVID